MIKLTQRLSAAASMVRDDSSLADVGCDHGYLPVYLIMGGKVKSAVAGDINEGPLASCRALVAEYNLEDRIKCVLSDGLSNISSDECSDVAICGMGGELISNILSDCSWTKSRDKHFIFNPMTHPEILRKYLYDNGFCIGRDIVVKEGCRYYSVFEAVYDGKKRRYSDIDCFLGNIDDFTHKEYFVHILNHLENKMKGGSDYSDVAAAIKEKL